MLKRKIDYGVHAILLTLQSTCDICIKVTVMTFYLPGWRKDKLTWKKTLGQWWNLPAWTAVEWFSPPWLCACAAERQVGVKIFRERIHGVATGWYQAIIHLPSWQIYPVLLHDRHIIIIFLVSTLLKCPRRDTMRRRMLLVRHYSRFSGSHRDQHHFRQANDISITSSFQLHAAKMNDLY